MSSTSWVRRFIHRPKAWRHTISLTLLLLLPLAAWAQTSDLTAPTTTTLTATKTVDLLTIPQSGGQLVYGIHITNTGSAIARNVIMGDNIPANATFVSTLPGCSFQPGSAFGRGIVVCVPQDVAPGQTIATQVVVRTDANLPCGTQIVNVGDVEADNVPLLWTNKVMTTVDCPAPPPPSSPASLNIQKSVSVATVPQSGGLITYGITVTNTGNTIARGVLVGDNIPANATYVPGTSDCAFQPGSVFGRGILVCPRQDLAPGQSFTKQFTVRSDVGLACNTQIVNVADLEAFNLPQNWSNKVMTRVDCPVTPTPTPTITPTPTPKITPTPTVTVTPTPTPTITPIPTPKITPTPTPKITPTPTPTITPTPTPTVTPTATPTPEIERGIDVSKTDHRDITRPGHNLTYIITVENKSNVDLHDVRITDDVPGQLTVASISHSGRHEGSQIIWSNLEFSAGEKREFSYTATIKLETANGHLLVNDVRACSSDHNICDVATDATRVERVPQVAGITTAPTTVNVVTTPSGQVVHVPITAPTGAGALGSVATLIGGSWLALVFKKFW